MLSLTFHQCALWALTLESPEFLVNTLHVLPSPYEPRHGKSCYSLINPLKSRVLDTEEDRLGQLYIAKQRLAPCNLEAPS